MIVGNGLIARAFAARYGRDAAATVFASGVSNSGETRAEAFEREERLLAQSLAQHPALLVYFSTCSVDDPELSATPYVRHKLRMEARVRQSEGHLILRLPQVVGRTDNPATLTNYLYAHIAGGKRFAVWKNAWRNIIDIEDVAKIAGAMISDAAFRGRSVDIATPHPIRVPDLVAVYERILGVAAKCEEVDRGDRYDIDVRDAMAVAKRLGVSFDSDYVEKVVRHYYGQTPRSS
jgi:nucleoside-diphosphate-sugar epimerase